MTRVDLFGHLSAVPATLERAAPMLSSLLRGVVVSKRTLTGNDGHVVSIASRGILCDVLLYMDQAGRPRTGTAPNCAVLQLGGLRWEPETTVFDLSTGGYADLNNGNPLFFDGTHVIVGFVDQHSYGGLILGALDHPTKGLNTEFVASREAVTDRGRYTQMQGTVVGINDIGDHVVDTSRAFSLPRTPTGLDPTLPIDVAEPTQLSGFLFDSVVDHPDSDSGVTAVGNIRWFNRTGQHFTIEQIHADVSSAGSLYSAAELPDMLVNEEGANGDAVSSVRGAGTVSFNPSSTMPVIDIGGSEGSAYINLGDGAVSAAVAEHLQQLYIDLKTRLDEFITDFNAHGHAIDVASMVGLANFKTASAGPVTTAVTQFPTSKPVLDLGSVADPVTLPVVEIVDAPSGATPIVEGLTPEWQAAIVSSQLKIPNTRFA